MYVSDINTLSPNSTRTSLITLKSVMQKEIFNHNGRSMYDPDKPNIFVGFEGIMTHPNNMVTWDENIRKVLPTSTATGYIRNATLLPAEWEDWFQDKDVCFAPVLDLKEAWSRPHVVQREMLLRDTAGNLHIGTPLKFRDEPGFPDLTLPKLDEHGAKIRNSAKK